MRGRLGAFAVLLAIACAATAHAGDEPRTLARARLDPAGPIGAGQTVRLVVDVLTTTFFTAAPEYPPLDLAGAIVTLSDEQAAHLTEEHDAEEWFGLSRVYLVTPTDGGTLAIPPLAVTVHPGPGSASVVVTTEALTVAVEAPPRPPGAEHAVGTTRLTATQHLDRALTGLRVGDAVKRTIAISADGARAMLLPPTAFPPIDGLAVYPDAPDVEDVRDDRGAFTGGRRVDAATYVVQRAGSYELPAVSMGWWNTKTQRLETASVPAVPFTAAAAPEARPEIALPAEAARPGIRAESVGYATIVAAAALLAWLVAPNARRGVRRLAARRAEQRRRYAASEPVAFARVRVAALGNDPAGTYTAATAWLARFRPGGAATLARLSAVAADAELTTHVDALARQLYGSRALSWSGRPLLAELERVRRRLGEEAQAPVAALPPLNPV